MKVIGPFLEHGIIKIPLSCTALQFNGDDVEIEVC